ALRKIKQSSIHTTRKRLEISGKFPRTAANHAKMSPKGQRMPRFLLKLLLNQPRNSNWTPSLAPELGDGPLVTGVSSTVFSCRRTTVGAACLEAEHRTEISK